MKIKLIRTVKRVIPLKAKMLVNLLYLKFFQLNLYNAFLDYRYTDERLKFIHILEAVNYARVACLPHVYFEFGCHSARTFSAAVRAARYLKMDDAQFYAFDSFQGLPEVDSEEEFFEKGSFHTPKNEFKQLVKKKSGFNLPEKNIIDGFYDVSLTTQLQNQMPKVGVVHIDVDLYSSTVDVLKFISPLLVIGSVLIFDDWHCYSSADKGESRALDEFCKANPRFSIEEWKSYSTFGKSFFVRSLP